MERFVVKKRNGAQRAIIATHEYCRERKRTRTVYLGSLSLDLDPSALANESADIGASVSIKAGAIAQGRPFVLDAEVRQRMADWLNQHGNHVKRVQAAERTRSEALAAAETARRLMAAELRVQIEDELRRELRFELDAQRPNPLDAARLALETACDAVVAEARAWRSAGYELSRMRGSVAGSSQSNPLDELRMVSEHLRKTSFGQFEAACKEAGLMSTRVAS
jgi:hypothetical protein